MSKDGGLLKGKVEKEVRKIDIDVRAKVNWLICKI